jgi:hypothetical protein
MNPVKNIPQNCGLCFEDLTPETHILFRMEQNAPWQNLVYCKDCLHALMNDKWNRYFNVLKTEECRATLKTLIEIGPPTRFRDNGIEKNCEIYEFYYDDKIYPATLKIPLTLDQVKELSMSLINDILPLLDEKNFITNDEFRIAIAYILNPYNL